VIAKIRAMVGTLGFRLKQGKETVVDAGSRMIATKLVVTWRVALPSQRRSKIRAAVKAFEHQRARMAAQWSIRLLIAYRASCRI